MIFIQLRSCDKDKEDCCINIDATVLIAVNDSNGNNIVTQELINNNLINVYYKENGKYQRFENNNSHAIKGWGFEVLSSGENPSSNENLIKLYLNTNRTNNVSETILEIKGVKDTITSTFYDSTNNLLKQKISLNGDLVWEKGKNKQNYSGSADFVLIRE